MSLSNPFRALSRAALLSGVLTAALGAPTGAQADAMRGYQPLQGAPAAVAPTPSVAPARALPTIQTTGRDRVSIDRTRVGARVGDSLLRLAPSTNRGIFTQFENYRGSVSATTTVDGANYGTVVTNQNGNILGLIGNNGIVDSSAGLSTR